jgi:hypothetical protein
MVRGIARRISMLERFARGIAADVFMARAERLARRMGTDYRAAVAKLGNELDDYDLDRLIAELERIVYGDDPRQEMRHGEGLWRQRVSTYERG